MCDEHEINHDGRVPLKWIRSSLEWNQQCLHRNNVFSRLICGCFRPAFKLNRRQWKSMGKSCVLRVFGSRRRKQKHNRTSAWNSESVINRNIENKQTKEKHQQPTTTRKNTSASRKWSNEKKEEEEKIEENDEQECMHMCACVSGMEWVSMRQQNDPTRKENGIEREEWQHTKAVNWRNERIWHPNETRKQSTATTTSTMLTTASAQRVYTENRPPRRNRKRQTCPAIMAAINVILALNLHGNRFYVLHKLQNNKFLFVIIFHGRCVAFIHVCLLSLTAPPSARLSAAVDRVTAVARFCWLSCVATTTTAPF